MVFISIYTLLKFQSKYTYLLNFFKQIYITCFIDIQINYFLKDFFEIVTLWF